MKRRIFVFLFAVALSCSPLRRAGGRAASNVPRIYIEKMADNLDQYLASPISSKFHRAVTVVPDRKDADAILKGVNIGAQTTEKTTVQLVDPGEHLVLWSGTAGDRKMLTLDIAHGSQQKIADNLIGQLRKAMRK